MHLRTTLISIVSTLAVAAPTLGLATPATAASAPPVVVSPADGGTLVGGSTGPLVIDFPTGGEYSVSVECDHFEYYWLNDSDTYYSGPTSIPIDPVQGFDGEDLSGRTCTITTFGLAGGSYLRTQSTFTVTAPSLSLGDVRATKTTFYPLVKDKYLDETEFRFHINRNTDASLTVTDAKGRTVYEESGRLDEGAGLYRWPWKGETTSGKPVKPGKYRGTITATADGATLKKSATVRVATKIVNRKTTIRKDYLSSRDSTKGNCQTSFSEYDETTTLDCWGGVFAATTFTFKIPANAKRLDWNASTGRTQLDKCCRGSITKRGYRVGRTKFQIRVQVTGWRAVDVYGARLSYKARVKI